MCLDTYTVACECIHFITFCVVLLPKLCLSLHIGSQIAGQQPQKPKLFKSNWTKTGGKVGKPPKYGLVQERSCLLGLM